MRTSLLIVSFLTGFAPKVALSQQQSSYPTEMPDGTQTDRAKISGTLFSSQRDTASGGFIAPFADGLDAATQNPASIGTLRKTDKTWLSQFHFPYGSGSYNNDSRPMLSNMINGGGASKTDYADAITKASEGTAQYARFSIVPDFALGRLLIAPILDEQLAATRIADDSEVVELLHQKRLGVGGGIGFSDPSGALSLGFFAAASTLTRTEGHFLAADVADEDLRGEAFKGKSVNYSGLDMHAGIKWQFAKTANPVLSLTANHLGDTVYKTTKADHENIIDPRAYNFGVGISPSVKQWAKFNFGAGFVDLTNQDVDAADRWRVSAEINLLHSGSLALSGMRIGGNSKGLSYGSHVNIGFISLQYANFPEDIGAGGERVIERLNSAAISVDLAD